METILDILITSLLYAPLALGLMITFKVTKIWDLTVDGSFAIGACITAALNHYGYYELSLFGAIIGGALAGLSTSILYNVLKVNQILAGMLVMISLISINTILMGASYLAFTDKITIFTSIESSKELLFIALLIIIVIIVVALNYFFKTETGLHFIANGYNPKLLIDLGRNPITYLYFSLMIANALIALSGGLVALRYGYADINIGLGQLLNGLAVLILGKTIRKIIHKESIFAIIISIVIGGIIYQSLLTIITSIGIPDVLNRLTTTIIILIPIIAPMLLSKIFTTNREMKQREELLEELL